MNGEVANLGVDSVLRAEPFLTRLTCTVRYIVNVQNSVLWISLVEPKEF